MDKLIVISKPDCGGCTMVKNFLDSNEVEYEMINGFERTDVLIEFDVMSFPVTILLDENEQEIDRVNGFNPEALNLLIEDF